MLIEYMHLHGVLTNLHGPDWPFVDAADFADMAAVSVFSL